jgi:hypothetical protein
MGLAYEDAWYQTREAAADKRKEARENAAKLLDVLRGPIEAFFREFPIDPLRRGSSALSAEPIRAIGSSHSLCRRLPVSP